MSVPQPAARFSRADYFEWEALQVGKNEYVAGEVFAMVGARQAHVVVSLALAARFREHLRGTRCRAYGADMKLEVVAADAVFYPDVMVSCDEADRQRDLALQAPKLIVEVLSDSTAAYDRGAKFAAYRKLDSLHEYLLVDIDARRLELFRREPVGWVLHEPAGANEPVTASPSGAAAEPVPVVLHLASIGLELTGTDVFGDLQE
jgi:Uma2 family endonuclease